MPAAVNLFKKSQARTNKRASFFFLGSVGFQMCSCTGRLATPLTSECALTKCAFECAVWQANSKQTCSMHAWLACWWLLLWIIVMVSDYCNIFTCWIITTQCHTIEITIMINGFYEQVTMFIMMTANREPRESFEWLNTLTNYSEWLRNLGS